MSRFPALALSALFLAGLQSPSVSRADEGVLEINQACATTGCFAGDTAGLPVTITASGSYRMTSSLVQMMTSGSPAAVDAIVIDADDVSLDMRGFSISCVETTSGPCTGTAGGVRADNFLKSGIFVHDGIVSGMPGHGFILGSTAAHAKNLIARNNGGEGIRTGTAITDGGLVENCIAMSNGSNGITVGATSIIRGCVSKFNGGAALLGLSFSGGTRSGYTGCASVGTITDLSDLGANFP